MALREVEDTKTPYNTNKYSKTRDLSVAKTILRPVDPNKPQGNSNSLREAMKTLAKMK